MFGRAERRVCTEMGREHIYGRLTNTEMMCMINQHNKIPLDNTTYCKLTLLNGSPDPVLKAS